MIEIGDVYEEKNTGRIYVITRESPFGRDVIYPKNGEVITDCRVSLIEEDKLIAKYNTFIEAIVAYSKNEI